MKYRVLALSVMLGLNGCASNSSDVATLENLDDRSFEFAQPRITTIDRDQAIENYRAFLEIARSGTLHGNAMRRLADLELEAGEENNMSTNPDLTQAGQREIESAIELYTAYLRTYPARKTNDLILYQLSRAYNLVGEPENALQSMNQLVHNYPDTRYYEEVQFRRGEILFVLKEYAQAELAYAGITRRFKNSQYYERSLYKLGWSQFKQNQYNKSLSSYLQLLDRKKAQGKLLDHKLAKDLPRADKEFIDDTLRVVSLAFSYQQGANSIKLYFAANGSRSFEPLLYKRLGKLYRSKERYTDAAEVYLAYVASNPQSPLAPVFHTDAIDTYKQGNFPQLVLSAKEDFVKRYGTLSRFWEIQDENSRAQIQPLLTRHMRELATHYHAQARKTGKAAEYKRAARWYATYLGSFPKDKDAANINYLLAESQFDAKQYGKAVLQYEKTAYHYPPHKKSAEAAFAALVAYKKLTPRLKAKDKPLWHQRAINSALRFSKTWPNDKRVPAVVAKTAEDLFALKDYPRAISTAQIIIERKDLKHPALQRTAWTVYGHAHFETGDYLKAEHAYQTLLKKTPRKHKQYKAISDRLAASIYKQGEQQRDKGAYAVAAATFLRVGKAVPSSSLRATADYDAATMYIQTNDWPKATKVLENFRRRYPKQKKLQQGVTEKLALAYSKTGQGAKAATELLALAKASGNKTYQREMTWQAAELYTKAGKKKKAVKIYKDYIKKYPRPLPEAMEARFEIAEYYRHANNPKEWGHWLNEIVKADHKGGKQRTPRTNYLAATALLELVKPHMDSYKRAKLRIPLKKSLKKKKRLMEKAVKAYERALHYKVAEVTTAATFQIAEVYKNFADSLMNSQRPKKLSADELEQYDILLEEQAFPFEEKAINIHESNISRTRDGIYDKWVKQSLNKLSELQPVRYAKSEKTETYIDALN